ncbi:DUF551 domain-containing protein [Escherichia coli]|nr:DUF551 domain-containing protein [Escherichia coli]
MKTFTIGWLNKCRCGNKSHTVKTARGNESGLWDDDAVKCNSCGRGGVIQVCEGQARVLWETDEEMAEGKPMSTITKEWLQHAINAYDSLWDGPFDLDDYQGKILVALRIALASLEAEPVAYIRDGFRTDGVHFCGGIITAEEHERTKPALSDRYNWKHQPLYTAPPSPVAPDLKELEEILEWILMLPCPTPKATHFAKRLAVVIDTCRAAMLQGADGNSPVIPDSWVACSERMPEDGEKVLTSFRGGMRTAVCKVVDVLGHKIFVDELTLFIGVPADYWQPLPAAPQQKISF